MTSKKLALYSALQWIIFIPLKIWFFNYPIFSNAGIEQIFFWLVVAAIGGAVVRKLGIINFFESFFITVIWFLGGLLLDFLITGRFTGTSLFSNSQYWFGWVALALSIFVFHKKKHIHARHQLHAQAHAQAHGHSKPH
jgi:hypothetical protein